MPPSKRSPLRIFCRALPLSLSLLLFVATVVVWLRSESHIDFLTWKRWPVQWEVDCLRGEVQLSRTVRGGAASWRDHDGFRRDAITVYGRPEAMKDEGTTRLARHAGGFAYVQDDAGGFPQLARDPSPRRLLILPLWSIALLTGAAPAWWLARFMIGLRRRTRSGPGLTACSEATVACH